MTWDGKLFARHLLTRRFGRELRHFEEIDSTNAWLAENHDDFIVTGAVVVADHQTKGRGRQERSWLDLPERSLLFSVLLRSPAISDGAELLSLLPAIALARTLRDRVSQQAKVSLKWPNDVLLNGRKVAGILGQSSIQAGQRLAILGVGCNVSLLRGELPAEFREHATSILDETGTEIPREVLLAEFLQHLEAEFDRWTECQFDALCAEWESFGPPRGTALTRTEGGATVVGQYAGLGPRGQLRLRDGQGRIQELFSGDVQA